MNARLAPSRSLLLAMLLRFAATALTATAAAQCPLATDAGLVPWTAAHGYASTLPIDDEGLGPVVSLGFAFPMPVPSGTVVFDEMWIDANGELYLNNSSAPLPEPVGGSLYGTDNLVEMRGRIAGGSPRIVPLGGDHHASRVACNIWAVSYETPLTGGPAGQARVTWTDLARWGDASDRFSFSCRLFAGGTVEFSYGNSIPAGLVGHFVGISIGDLVGPTEPSKDFSNPLAAISTVGLLYQHFAVATDWDLGGQTLRIVRAGDGYAAATLNPYAAADCAYHCPYGEGCHEVAARNTAFQTWSSAALAKAAMEGNRITWKRSGDTYTSIWNGNEGTPFSVAPANSELTYSTQAAQDDGFVTVTTPPIPVSGGIATDWSVSVNGILTAAASANNDGNWAPNPASVTNATLAPHLAFYSWRDYFLNDYAPVVNGTITAHFANGWFYVSWNAVETHPLSVTNPSTWQFQVDMATGDVTVVWQSLSNEGFSTLIGCTLAGPGATPGVADFATGSVLLNPAVPPLSLAAAPRPVGPMVGFDYTIGNIPEYVPGSGTYLAFVGLGLQPLPGIDLAFLGATGCKANVDVLFFLPAAMSPMPVAWSSFGPFALPAGFDFYAQAIAVFDPAAHPELNAAGLVTSNGVLSHVEFQ